MIALYAGRINWTPELIKELRTAVKDFGSELFQASELNHAR